jgi:integrase
MRNQKVCRQKPKLTSFGNSELETKIRETFKARLGAKRKTVEMYALTLARFCKSENVEPFDFETLGLETIEDKCENFIRQNQDRLSPKYLNVIFNAVKSWCFCTKLIKSRKLFREIKFDKSSRKFDAINEVSLETSHIKQMIQTSDMDTKILVGLYAFAGLRPALIPQLTVGDFAVNDYTLQNGKIEFQNKNPFLYVNKNYEGNKAHITFFVMLHSKITELLETALNSNSEAITPKTAIMRKYNSRDSIYQKICALFASIGFSGRPYLLRSFADKVLDRHLVSSESGQEKRDEDLKEFMLGHKGKISAVYQLKALSIEDAQQYRKMYDNVDKWLCEKVFGMASEDAQAQAQAQARIAQKFGVDPERLETMLETLQSGKMTMQAFDEQLTTAINAAQQKTLESKFEVLFKQYVATHIPVQ